MLNPSEMPTAADYANESASEANRRIDELEDELQKLKEKYYQLEVYLNAEGILPGVTREYEKEFSGL